MHSATLVLGALALGATGTPHNTYGNNFEQRCASLSSRLTDAALGYDAIVQPPQFVKAGTTVYFNGSDPTCTRPSQLASIDLCRVALNVTTSPTSKIRMEAWLPSNWTGRFLATGNGGLGGCIQYEDMEYAAAFGFAAVGANNGKDGTSGAPFQNAPEVIKDYSYRSVHLSTVIGKKISRIFYGKSHKKAYYNGCSTGGRQGFKLAQQFPNDFDGIVAGAPAFSFNNLTSWSCNFLPVTGRNTSVNFVPLSFWPTILRDVLDQCDTLDGVADRILEDPDKCNYNPGRLACTNGATTNCLTPIQVDIVRKVFSPLIDPSDGSLVYPRLQPGLPSISPYFTGQPFFSADWFTYAVLQNPNWDPLTLTYKDWQLSERLNLGDVSTWKGDLSSFKRSNGKILHYHGTQDGIISSENSPRYYDHVSKTMKLSPKQLDKFYRYFRVSGMGHCAGGTGAFNIGNRKSTFSGSIAPEDNVLWAMVNWVEKGEAPEFVRGVAFNNATVGAASGVKFKRNHCKWPAKTTYKSGDPTLLDSWTCA